MSYPITLEVTFEVLDLKVLRRAALKAREKYWFDAAEWAQSSRAKWRDDPDQAARDFLFELCFASNEHPAFNELGVELVNHNTFAN